jgi:hypothetical protein
MSEQNNIYLKYILDCNKESLVTLQVNLHTKLPISNPRLSRRWNERLVHAGVGDLASLTDKLSHSNAALQLSMAIETYRKKKDLSQVRHSAELQE